MLQSSGVISAAFSCSKAARSTFVAKSCLGVLSICIILLLPEVRAQIAYTQHLSTLRIQELHNIAASMNSSLNHEKYACDNYYEYVCSRHRPMFSIMGHLPDIADIMQLHIELHNDPLQFDAKQKLIDFFISCNDLKSVQDCYRESFEYFKPVFAYIITKNHVDSSSHELSDFLHILNRFWQKTNYTDNFIFRDHPIRHKLAMLREKFRTPHLFFKPNDLSKEYRALRIYRESYQHNLRNLDEYLRHNSTYQQGLNRNMLDWTMFVYQIRSKPMSYYFPTLNVHLWMTLYNTTVRYWEQKEWLNITDCLRLPQYVNILEEARILAVVYLKSFYNAWDDYREWRTSTTINEMIFDKENNILRKHDLHNNRIFFTLYAQNFCDFGKELAEHIFYLGLKNNQDFHGTYSCGPQTEKRCV